MRYGIPGTDMQLVDEELQRLGTRTNAGVPARAPAFWVRGRVAMLVARTHVRAVMAHPDHFELTREWVMEQFAAAGERPGTEGRARSCIIAAACGHGWLRVRHYRSARSDYWMAEVDDVTAPGRMEQLRSFVHFALAEGMMHPEDEVRVADGKVGLATCSAADSLLLSEYQGGACDR